jgi:hypothetical protein
MNNNSHPVSIEQEQWGPFLKYKFFGISAQGVTLNAERLTLNA